MVKYLCEQVQAPKILIIVFYLKQDIRTCNALPLHPRRMCELAIRLFRQWAPRRYTTFLALLRLQYVYEKTIFNYFLIPLPLFDIPTAGSGPIIRRLPPNFEHYLSPFPFSAGIVNCSLPFRMMLILSFLKFIT